jgi:transposase
MDCCSVTNPIRLPSHAEAILLGRQIGDLNARIKEIDAKLAAAHKANAMSQRMATIPGVGAVTTLTLAVEIDPAAFESGWHPAAWAGLTPRARLG